MKVWKPDIERFNQPLYLALISALQADIDCGSLAVNDRLPTQRELADSLGIAIGTVTRAYAEAERRGLIHSEGRRGTFVGGMQTSRSMLASLVKERPDAIDLSKNHPSYDLDPDLAVALKELSRASDIHRLLEYPSTAGMTHHREAGARWLGELGMKTDPDSVFITAGAQHALSVILGAEMHRGETICTDNFTYLGMRAIAQQQDLNMIGLEVDEVGIMPDSFEAACRHHRVRVLYCMPTISNPTNRTMTVLRREEIAGIAAKYGVTVIEDEIMRPLVPEQSGFIAELLPDQTYLVVSTSKALAAGLRVGVVRAPDAARQRMVESLTASCICLPPLMIELFARWLDDGTVRDVVTKRQQDIARRQKMVDPLLDGFVCHRHPCSYHCWLELPDGWTSVRLAMETQAQGVVVSPGEVFATESHPAYEAVRISVVSPSAAELEQALGIITGLLRGTITPRLPTV